MIFVYLLSGLFLGWSLGANDTGNIFGAAVETRMLKFKSAALIAAIFIALGAILEGSGPSGTLGKLGSVDALGGAFTVALAAAATITVIVRTGIPVSTSQTIVGAIIGWNYFSHRLTDFRSLLTIASSWVSAFLLAGLIAAGLYYIFRDRVNRSKVHLLEQDFYTRLGLIVIGAFGAYSLGANNIANVVGVFVPVTPFKDLNIGGLFVLSGVMQLYILGTLSIIIGIYTYSHKVMRTVGKDLFQLSPLTALIALLSEAIVLFMFSSRGLYNLLHSLHLPTIPLVPVSSSQVIVGAIVGIGLAKGGKNIRYNILGKISIAWVAAPVIAFFFSFVALFIIQNVFEQTVHMELSYVFDRVTITEIERQGYDTKHFSMVNGRSFENEITLFNELKEQSNFNHEELLDIIRVTEVHTMTVDTEILQKKGMTGRFSAEQWKALDELDGRKYRHKWQLAEDLANFPCWQISVDKTNPIEKNRNHDINANLDTLYRSFYLPKKPK